jgi:hypothetical protein
MFSYTETRLASESLISRLYAEMSRADVHSRRESSVMHLDGIPHEMSMAFPTCRYSTCTYNVQVGGGGKLSGQRPPAAQAAGVHGFDFPAAALVSFFSSSWLTTVDEMKDLWCSSTIWLLSTQM